MIKLITLTLFMIGLCFSGATVFAASQEDNSYDTEDNTEKPKNIIENVKQRLKDSEELEKENREKALERDLEDDPQTEHSDDD